MHMKVVATSVPGTFQTWPTERTMSVTGVKAYDGRTRFDFRF
jgi:hypothetical protein